MWVIRKRLVSPLLQELVCSRNWIVPRLPRLQDENAIYYIFTRGDARSPTCAEGCRIGSAGTPIGMPNAITKAGICTRIHLYQGPSVSGSICIRVHLY